MWQEMPEESWFCLTCATCNDNIFRDHCDFEEKCEEGMMMALTDCEPGKTVRGHKKREANYFGVVEGDTTFEGVQFKLYETDLCLARDGRRNILLRTCNPSSKEQRWLGFQFGQEMELQPLQKLTIGRDQVETCLTQHHHPRKGERVYAEECKKARRTTTNLWMTY